MPDRPATLRDVAAAARVHPATASRALNPETRILVSEDTARRVTAAAARLGHTRIAHVAGPQEASTGMSRLRGFRDGMATHSLTVDEDLIAYATRYTVEEGARCCRELLARPGDFTAVAAANDMLAVGCYS